MSSEVAEELAAGMRERTDGLALGRDVLGEATRRHRRRTVLHRSAYAVGVFGVAGVVAVGVGAPAGTGGAPAGRGGASAPVAAGPSATVADTPRLRLAAAATASGNVSYRLRITTTVRGGSGTSSAPSDDSWVTEGAFDPATDTGFWDSPWEGKLRPSVVSGWSAEKLVGGVRYRAGIDGSDRSGRKLAWMREEGRHDHLDLDTAMGGGLGASGNPEELFRVLGQAGGTVTERGPGVYHFVLAVAQPSDKVLADRFVGEVRVGADHRISRVSYDRTSRPARSERPWHLAVLVEFSHYGEPVTVRPPEHLVG
ncbi:hypothetical protein [Micromonospora auratinigra]|uniref:Uncharacterized protein n=1 Tax=Micromonospora auratinigra TaxID=261654 RepID=A0A1A9A7C7_9ACTN|nr:hypothetical protein [Micromonospora auratinigra]SBT52379.1 hypothetical protein GA0070611_5608 [Micromonospora auratinigra]